LEADLWPGAGRKQGQGRINPAIPFGLMTREWALGDEAPDPREKNQSKNFLTAVLNLQHLSLSYIYIERERIYQVRVYRLPAFPPLTAAWCET
jgi:hypothetical protein